MKAILLVCALVLSASGQAQNLWTKLTPASNPGPRDSHNLVWDSESKRAILYGSHSSVNDPSYYNSTWAFDPATNIWTKMNPPGPDPGARAEYGLVYSSVHDRVFLFGGPASVWPGGTPGPDKTNDLWAYDFNSNKWTELTPALKPPPTGVCRVAYDSESDKIIYFESAEGNTWAYDYTTNTWQNMNPPPPRPLADWRMFTSMTYDSYHDRVVVVTPYPQNLWAYDYNANTWELRGSSPNDPIPNGGLYDLDYDSKNDKLVLYGDTKITWTYDWATNAWTNMDATPSPEAHHHAITFLPEYGKMLFYGGIVGSNNHTWTYAYGEDAGVDASQHTMITISPNPAYQEAKIYADQGIASVEVYDMTGTKMHVAYDRDAQVLHLHTLRAGVYTLRCSVGSTQENLKLCKIK